MAAPDKSLLQDLACTSKLGMQRREAQEAVQLSKVRGLDTASFLLPSRALSTLLSINMTCELLTDPGKKWGHDSTKSLQPERGEVTVPAQLKAISLVRVRF